MKYLVLAALYFLNQYGYALEGGIDAKLKNAPWAVKIFGCGGTLISDRFILTAAHCVINLSLDQIKPKSAIINEFKSLGQLSNVAEVFIHPEYSNWNKQNITIKQADIAILKLSESVNNSIYVEPIHLPVAKIVPEALIESKKSNLTIYGWGDTGEIRPTADGLKKIENIFLLPTYTSEFWNNKDRLIDLKGSRPLKNDLILTFLTGGYLLAKNRFGQSCKGDSGGPMVDLSSNTIIGISAHNSGFGCGNDKYFYYTDVHKYVDWIKFIINNN